MRQERRPTGARLPWQLAMGGLLLLSVGGCGKSQQAPSAPDPTSIAICHRGISPEELQAQIADLTVKATEQPGEAFWPYRMGELYLLAEQFDESKASFTQALSLDPVFAPALSLLSKTHYQLAEHDAGIALLEAAKSQLGEAFPEELETGLALHYRAAGRTDASDPMFDKLATSPASHAALTFHLLSGDGFEDAKRWAESAVERNDQSAANHNNLGISLLYDGDPQAAREAFLNAHRLDPELPGPMYNLAIVDRFYFFDDDQSRQWLDRYLAVSSYDPDGLQELLAESATDSTEGTAR